MFYFEYWYKILKANLLKKMFYVKRKPRPEMKFLFHIWAAYVMMREGLLLISKKLVQQGTGHGPNHQGAVFMHQLWVRSLRNEVPETRTQQKPFNSSFRISGARFYFWFSHMNSSNMREGHTNLKILSDSVVPSFHLPLIFSGRSLCFLGCSFLFIIFFKRIVYYFFGWWWVNH